MEKVKNAACNIGKGYWPQHQKEPCCFCGIRTFEPYIMAEGSQSDYYFISEKNREKLVEIYQKTLTLQPKF